MALPAASRCASRGCGRGRPKPVRRTSHTVGPPKATRADR
nr:MAG TPA: hypothetical protein [Caudoviricetes sp.]